MSSLQSKSVVVHSSATITASPAPASGSGSSSAASSLRNLKGSMTLPLQSSVNVGNNLAHIRGLTPLAQLNSPDLKNLGLTTSSGVTPFLTSPDFEKLVSQSLTVGITPTSAGGNAPQTPTTFLNPKFVTEEQERFVMNFDEKIKSMIKKEREGGVDENQLNTPVIMDISAGAPYNPIAGAVSSSTAVASSAETAAVGAAALSSSCQSQPASVVVTVSSCQQPQQLAVFSATTVSTTQHQPPPPPPPPLPGNPSSASYATDSDDPMELDASSSSPRRLDLGDQEQLKLERKRQRNRDAARKCRERKLERIRFLEERVAELKSQNGRLQRTAVDLREQVKTLQHVIVEHTKRGCSLKDSLSAKLGIA